MKDGKRRLKKPDQECCKKIMDSQKADGKMLNIQNKKQTPTKSHSTAVEHTLIKRPFICASPTTSNLQLVERLMLSCLSNKLFLLFFNCIFKRTCRNNCKPSKVFFKLQDYQGMACSCAPSYAIFYFGVKPGHMQNFLWGSVSPGKNLGCITGSVINSFLCLLWMKDNLITHVIITEKHHPNH